TAATDLAVAGCTIEDVMAVGGWQTAAVARRYNLGNLDALRGRIAAARGRGTVVRLAGKRKAGQGAWVGAPGAVRCRQLPGGWGTNGREGGLHRPGLAC